MESFSLFLQKTKAPPFVGQFDSAQLCYKEKQFQMLYSQDEIHKRNCRNCPKTRTVFKYNVFCILCHDYSYRSIILLYYQYF